MFVHKNLYKVDKILTKNKGKYLQIDVGKDII